MAIAQSISKILRSSLLQTPPFLYQNGSPYLPVPLLATIGQLEKQHRGSANRKRESM